MRPVSAPSLVAITLGLALAACSPGPSSAPAADSAAPAAGDAPAPVAAAQADGPPPACSTGRTKAVTNVCDDGNPALFRAIDAKKPLLTPKCVWITDQLMLSEQEYLVFRTQDCSAEGWDGEAYAYADGKVKAGSAATPYAIDRVVLEILPLGQGQSAKQTAINTLVTAPPDEQQRCTIRNVADSPFAGETFELAPNEAFQAELDQSGEVWTACGEYGVGGSVQMFEARGNQLFFHRLGQDDGYYDPASFTLYRPDGAGGWKKAAD